MKSKIVWIVYAFDEDVMVIIEVFSDLKSAREYRSYLKKNKAFNVTMVQRAVYG